MIRNDNLPRRIAGTISLIVMLCYGVPIGLLEAQITIYATKDAYCEAVNGNANYNNQNLKVGVTSSPLNQYFVGLYFDLPAISSNEVKSAQLILTKQSGSGVLSTSYLLPITCDWNETQFTGNFLNNHVSFSIISTINHLSGDISIDVTNAFKEWLDNPSNYHGVVLYPQNSGSVTTFIYYDREHGDSNTRPRIVVHNSTASLQWNQIGSLNVSRLRARSEVLTGQILCIGGLNGSTALSTFETYQSGQWHNGNSQLSVPRYEFTSCILQNKVFVFGGQNGTDVTDVAESFDGSVWIPAGVMPVHIYDLDGTVLGSDFYIFGGLKNIQGTFTYDNKVRKYSPSFGWTEVGNISPPPSSDFTFRSGYRCVSVGGYIYVIGGAYAPTSTSIATYHNDVWRFDPSASPSNQFVQKTSMHDKRADFACLVIGGNIYAIGGVSDSNPATSIEVYDPQTDMWTSLVDQPDLSIPQPSSTVLNNKIYVIGIGANYVSCYESNELLVPIQLATFTATVLNQSQVRLNWTTVTEINNYGFEIERRVVGQLSDEWKMIGFLSGSGTSNSPHEYSFIDHNLSPGRYAYCIKQIDNDGSFKYYGNAEVEVLAPSTFALNQNYPNPFNSSTIIRYSLPSRSLVRLEIFNSLGQRVEEVVNLEQEVGYREVTWHTSVSSGIYFYRIVAISVGNPNKQFINSKRMILLK